MVQMRTERRLLDVSEVVNKQVEVDTASWRADVAEHGLKECALPSCNKRAASVQQYKCCSPVAPFGAARRSTGRCTGRSTSPSAAQRLLRRRLPRKGARALREIKLLFLPAPRLYSTNITSHCAAELGLCDHPQTLLKKANERRRPSVRSRFISPIDTHRCQTSVTFASRFFSE